MSAIAEYREALRRVPLTQRVGKVRQLGGLAIDVCGLDARIGELCSVWPRQDRKDAPGPVPVLAEVVAVASEHLTLMPYGSLQGLAAGCDVVAQGLQPTVMVGNGLLGRVIDAFGHALDGGAPPVATIERPLRAGAPNPMDRPRIEHVLETGVRSIDALLTLGQGQRVGIFAGSGIGKSTLLGMIARHVKADVNVIALVGERGREVREFIEKQLGPEGLARSVVVVATSDQPALTRLRAAYAALAIAEHFRDSGKQVLLTMDSVTRFAMARREVGLAAGEPPTARGYTPSVFAELPQLCERCGTAAGGGAITALMTVLVEGDDLSEPVSDNLRAILDGHIVLSRQLAHAGQYPAIDLLKSASRVMADVATAQQKELASRALKLIALLERNRQMVEIGAYERGTNPELDAALAAEPELDGWLRQNDGGASRAAAIEQLGAIVAMAGRSQPIHGGRP
jgi:flagellum-specific ATP synthase